MSHDNWKRIIDELDIKTMNVVEMVFGNMDLGGIYQIDELGRSYLDRLSKKYPMHVARKLRKVEVLDIIGRTL